MASLSSLAYRPIAPRRARAARASASASRSAPSRRGRRFRHAPLRTVASVLGCMTMGWRYASSECDDDVSAALMRAFVDAGHSELDTARAYAGDAEKIMGRVLASDPDLAARVSVATKANPWPGGNNLLLGEGGLAPDELRAQVKNDRAALAPAGVDLLYLHAPAAATPRRHPRRARSSPRRRRVSSLGLSNFSAWETVRIHRACLDAGLPAPGHRTGACTAA